MDTAVRRNIVVSAVNIRKGGTLTVLRDCLQYLSGREDLHVTALVHKRELCDFPGIDYIELPWSAESWLKRLKCEYITMHGISGKLPETDLWLSLHDTTPRVKARRQAVYCHTSFPFMKPTLQDWRMDKKIVLFSLFTRYAYKWNVKRNSCLIVQQDWMRRGLSQMLHFPQEKIIVAPPSFQPAPVRDCPVTPPMFLCVGTPDCHKNFETLCEAAGMVEQRLGKGAFRVVITVKGDENRYAAWLHSRWRPVDAIEFRGLLSREELSKAYGEASCLVFPSRTETWGLPISEFLPTGKPMILADLPYAHNTSAGAKQVAFFPVTDAKALAGIMQDLLEGRTTSFGPAGIPEIRAPYAASWDKLFNLLLP
jgi:glycosyltransferase involved in cell wall biosynthesis